MRFITAFTLFLGVVAAKPIPEDDTSAPPGHTMKFLDFSYGGTGCPQGSVGATIAEDGSLMNVKYDSLYAETGPDTRPSDRRKYCQLNIEIEVPHGYQYSIMQTDYRGYCYLEEGLTASQKATYYFTGQTNQLTRTTPFTGPYDDTYTISDRIGMQSVVWSPCGTSALLNLKSEAQIRPMAGDSGKSGLMTVDATDHKFEQIHYFQWRKCPAED